MFPDLLCLVGLTKTRGILLTGLVLICSSLAFAEGPRHLPNENHRHDTHQVEGLDTKNQKMAGHAANIKDVTEDSANAHGDSAARKHVHSAGEGGTDEAFGLDERLGAFIPLELTFRDENGQEVQLRDLVTKPTVIAPIYYHCPNVCHFLQGDFARVLPQVKLTAGQDYQVLSVSFDETEKPELAKRSRDTYYAAMPADFPAKGWRFLTGERDAIKTLTDAAGFHFQRVGSDFLHPVAFFVVDSEGKIVRYLHGTHILPKDLTLALYEAKEGRIGNTIRKVVQFCFSFDPERKTYVFNILRVSATAILLTLGIFLVFLIRSGKKLKRGSKS